MVPDGQARWFGRVGRDRWLWFGWQTVISKNGRGSFNPSWRSLRNQARERETMVKERRVASEHLRPRQVLTSWNDPPATSSDPAGGHGVGAGHHCGCHRRVGDGIGDPPIQRPCQGAQAEAPLSVTMALRPTRVLRLGTGVGRPKQPGSRCYPRCRVRLCRVRLSRFSRTCARVRSRGIAE